LRTFLGNAKKYERRVLREQRKWTEGFHSCEKFKFRYAAILF